MKKQTGFTLIEFAIAMGITAISLAATMLAFRNATLVNQNVTLSEDMSDNIRAGLNLMQQDLDSDRYRHPDRRYFGADRRSFGKLHRRSTRTSIGRC